MIDRSSHCRRRHVILIYCGIALLFEARTTIAQTATDTTITENDFAGSPYIPGGRKQLAYGEAPEYYKVEPGDTLFDVCDQLIDEATYWPKLWALNPGIRNPHFIFPGMVLSFFPGDDTTPPSLQIIAEEDILPIETGGLKESDLIAQPASELSQKDNRDASLDVKNILYDRQSQDNTLGGIVTEMEVFGGTTDDSFVHVETPAFILEYEPELLATVLSGPQGEVQVAEGGTVLIELESESEKSSQPVTILRPTGNIYSSNGTFVGYRYEFVAHAVINEIDTNTNTAHVQILKSHLGVMPDDIVVEYRSTARQYQLSDSDTLYSGSSAEIVGFEFEHQTMGIAGQLVYLDQAIPEGSLVPIYQRVDLRIPLLLRTSVPESTTQVGKVKILQSTGHSSLGVIAQSSIDLRIGDRTQAAVSP